MRHCIHRSGKVGLGGLFCIIGRGYHAISGPSALSPFTLDFRKASHSPFLVPRLSWRASITGAAFVDSSIPACVFCTLWCRISRLPSYRSREWSPVLNYVLYQISTTRCTVATQEAIQFSEVDRAGFVISSPTCLTVSRVNLQSRTLDVSPCKSSRRKEFYKDSSTWQKSSSMPGVKW